MMASSHPSDHSTEPVAVEPGVRVIAVGQSMRRAQQRMMMLALLNASFEHGAQAHLQKPVPQKAVRDNSPSPEVRERGRAQWKSEVNKRGRF